MSDFDKNNRNNDDWISEIDLSYGAKKKSKEGDSMFGDLSASLGAFVEEEISAQKDSPAKEGIPAKEEISVKEEISPDDEIYEEEFVDEDFEAGFYSAGAPDVKEDAVQGIIEDAVPEIIEDAVPEIREDAVQKDAEGAVSPIEPFSSFPGALGENQSESPENAEVYEEEYGEKDFNIPGTEEETSNKKKMKRKILIAVACVVGAILLFIAWMGLTPSGRKFAIGCVVNDIQSESGKNVEEDIFITPIPGQSDYELPETTPGETEGEISEDENKRDEEFVKSYLLIGIEEINGGKNTDSMIILSINTRDKTIKLTSLLRDTLVTIPGYKNRNKLNSAYARGGAELLMEVVQNTYDIKLSGYAYANFSAFETVVDLIGGVDIELGKAEAAYLNKTNYISNPAYRNVNAGWNHLNGNQTLGYCRVRKVVTLGGVNNDYGRTVRQRRVINAIIGKVKKMGLLDIYSLLKEATTYVKTNISNEEITEIISECYENEIFTVEECRLPYDGMFYDSGLAGIEGITYALVIDGHEEEIKNQFHEFIFNDPTKEEETTEQ